MSVLPEVPQYSYRYRYRQEYPEDYRKYTRIEYERYLDPAWNNWHVMVAETQSDKETRSSQIVALAVWDLSSINRRKYGGEYKIQDPVIEVNRSGGLTRRDVDRERGPVFLDAIALLKKSLDGAIDVDQIYLRILVVHSEFRRHGLASKLIDWGIAESKKADAAVALIASPPTDQFYLRLGFKVVGEEIAQAKGEAEKVAMRAMLLRHPSEKEASPT
ncbi:MAG: hypothetical protein M1821_001987 [Bathelium mastoideum]|nr:MAG: hypothetical protein M1821_001987 [Bathelium mastoideum]